MASHGRVLRRALAGLTAWLLALPCAALDPAKRMDQFTLDVWSPTDLGGAKTVFAIEETRDGYLWIGTSGGLSRFDGFRFELFEPANTPAFDAIEVRALLETADGDLWIGLYGGGLVRHHEGSFERIGGLPSPLVRALAAGPDGGVFVGAQGGGVALVSGGAVVKTISVADGLPSADVRALHRTRGGDLWIATEKGGASRLRGGLLRTFTSADGLSGDSAMALREDPEGGLWVATTRGLDRIADPDAATPKVEHYGPAAGLASDYIFSLGGDSRGNLFVGSGGNGLFRYAGGRFTALDSGAGLPGDYVWAFHEDSSGGLWVGVEGGLARLRDGLFTIWGARQGLPADQVHGLLEDRSGAIWIAGLKGLTRFSGGQMKVFGPAQGLPNAVFRSLLEARDGALWVSTEGGGVARLLDGKITIWDADDGVDTTMWSLAEDTDGAIWAGTQQSGVARFSGGRWQSFGRAEGLGADCVRVVLADRDGGVWAGTIGGGLTRLAGGKVAATYTTREGLAGNTILSLYQDEEGLLWVGTMANGLSLFRDGRFTSFDRRRGFFADGIGAIAGDGLGNLWFSAKGGIYRTSRRDLVELAAAGAENAAGLEVRGLKKSSGYRGAPGTGFTPAVFRTRDGRLLYPSSAGLHVIDPRAIGPPPAPAPAVVEALYANHRATPLRPAPVLPAGTYDLEIRYTAPSLEAPERTRFRYRLEGYDRDWVEVKDRRTAYYPNLPPGEFVFRVAAADQDGPWGEAAFLPVVLEPHFWQTRWFKALLAGLGAWALYGLYRLRAGRLEARAAVAEERNRIARDIHDTLAQDLAAILSYARRGQDAAAPDGEEAPLFEDIAALATGSLAEARRSLQALRPPALDGKNLAQALTDTARALSAGRDTEIRVHSTLGRDPGAAAETELLRIAKEAMGNALRHGGARRVEVELSDGGGEVLLEVRDDGAGFDPGISSAGYGLVGMRERAAALGGVLAVESAPGKGTTIAARIPAQEADA